MKKQPLIITLTLSKDLDRAHLLGKPVKQNGMVIGIVVATEIKGDKLLATVRVKDEETYTQIIKSTKG